LATHGPLHSTYFDSPGPAFLAASAGLAVELSRRSCPDYSAEVKAIDKGRRVGWHCTMYCAQSSSALVRHDCISSSRRGRPRHGCVWMAPFNFKCIHCPAVTQHLVLTWPGQHSTLTFASMIGIICNVIRDFD